MRITVISPNQPAVSHVPDILSGYPAVCSGYHIIELLGKSVRTGSESHVVSIISCKSMNQVYEASILGCFCFACRRNGRRGVTTHIKESTANFSIFFSLSLRIIFEQSQKTKPNQIFRRLTDRQPSGVSNVSHGIMNLLGYHKMIVFPIIF